MSCFALCPSRRNIAPPGVSPLVVLSGPSCTTASLAHKIAALPQRPFLAIAPRLPQSAPELAGWIHAARSTGAALLTTLGPLGPAEATKHRVLEHLAQQLPVRHAVVYQPLPDLIHAASTQPDGAGAAVMEFAATWKGMPARGPRSVGFLSRKDLLAAVQRADPQGQATLGRFASRMLGFDHPAAGQGVFLEPRANNELVLQHQSGALQNTRQLLHSPAGLSRLPPPIAPQFCQQCSAAGRSHAHQVPLCGTCLDILQQAADGLAVRRTLLGVDVPEIYRPYVRQLKLKVTMTPWDPKEFQLDVQPGFQNQTFANVVASVPAGSKWKDPYNIPLSLPSGDRFVPPEDALPQGTPIALFIKDPSAAIDAAIDDVSPSRLLEDSHLVAALGLISTLPSSNGNNPLKAMFTNVNEEKGVYEVQFYAFGKGQDPAAASTPIKVLVDRTVLVRDFEPWGLQNFFVGLKSYATPGELWPALLQKAMAKLAHRVLVRTIDPAIVDLFHPRYKTGDTLYGFEVFDWGCPASQSAAMLAGGRSVVCEPDVNELQKPDAAEKLSSDLKFLLKEKNYKVMIRFKVDEDGLVSNEDYPVLGVFESKLNPSGTEMVRLLRLRSPAGSAAKNKGAPLDWWCKMSAEQRVEYVPFEYTGDWSDCSPKWQQYPYVAKKLNYSPTNTVMDGQFYINAADVAKKILYYDIWEPRGTR